MEQVVKGKTGLKSTKEMKSDPPVQQEDAATKQPRPKRSSTDGKASRKQPARKKAKKPETDVIVKNSNRRSPAQPQQIEKICDNKKSKNKKSFRRQVRVITQSFNQDKMMESSAVTALHEASKAYLGDIFEGAGHCARHNDRTYMTTADMCFARRRGIERAAAPTFML